MSWFEKLVPRVNTNVETRDHSVPEGLWLKCHHCDGVLYRAELERNAHVCPSCDGHHAIPARERIRILLDEESFTELNASLESQDPLKFKDSKRYKDRVSAAQKITDEKDALITGHGTIKQLPVVVAVFNFRFMAGSMASVVGEKFNRAAEYALAHRMPLICFSASGGARMQESLMSLMQMAKTSAAIAKMGEARLPYISVLTNPTTGGVSASLAMLGEINIAEPKATIGFAGRRVIEQTVKQDLPEGFQSSEFLLEHGAIDMIIDRREHRDKLHSILTMLLRQTADGDKS